MSWTQYSMKIVIVCKWDSVCWNISGAGESVDVDEFLSAVTSMTPNAAEEQETRYCITAALGHDTLQ